MFRDFYHTFYSLNSNQNGFKKGFHKELTTPQNRACRFYIIEL